MTSTAYSPAADFLVYCGSESVEPAGPAVALGDVVLILFLLAQCFDGVFTYVGVVSFDSASKRIRWWLGSWRRLVTAPGCSRQSPGDRARHRTPSASGARRGRAAGRLLPVCGRASWIAILFS